MNTRTRIVGWAFSALCYSVTIAGLCWLLPRLAREALR